MEIDLNHAQEDGETAFCYGCCHKCSSSFCSCSVSAADADASSPIYLELWHACAGPLISLPRKGSVVVYFPQGHLEQAAAATSSSLPYQCFEMPTYGLPPQIFCRVVNVQLHADKETDEVYAQVTLFPEPELRKRSLDGKEEQEEDEDDEEGVDLMTKSTPHMFCKTLTASDTSTHGGFSVPRRAAEDCFPSLDYNLLRPSQELVAKDLHGVEWRFRHIYRGQPRRHLLTTGWSTFVNQKNLVSGDAVLFLRGENGELSLGIRRAGRSRNGVPCSIISSQDMHLSILSSAANSISTRSIFHIFYNPRASPAEFVIPYRKYVKSINHPVSIGMRFKMRFEMEDAVDRRYNGVITGIGDTDPLRWPDSKWRCLMVRWDEDIVSAQQERVSPWEIEPSVSLPAFSVPCGPRLKKLRASLNSTSADAPISVGAGEGSYFDFGESMKSSKVLQGQENVSSRSPYNGVYQTNQHLKMWNPAYGRIGSSCMLETCINNESLLVQSAAHSNSIGFGGSKRFQKVLQGQEIFSFPFLGRITEFNHNAWEKSSLRCSIFNVSQRPNLYPYVSEGTYPYLRNHLNTMPVNELHGANCVPPMQPLMADLPRDGGVTNLSCAWTTDDLRADEGDHYLGTQEPTNVQNPLVAAMTQERNWRNAHDETKTGCKLFGFSLTGENPVPDMQVGSDQRSCTKVHKQGILVGRAIDLSKLHGYDDLMIELERLFNMEGLLCDPEKGWQVVYTDSEHDMMLVGDDPWHS
ncbi:auxin response factor 4 isoform X2 [Magnolia sinica]|uniref:auxin response factor 4 isoform X2 n=1 Tax=Magnolia sinica TaxID=86752 RepID=UPI00265905BA|nr:auxin response factor 4 isoform X2 [Magnolia sinica]